MRQTDLLLLVVVASAVFASCLGEEHDRCGEGFTYENNSCIKEKSEETPDEEWDAGGAIDPEQWIGTACSCSPLDDSPCDISDIPMISQGDITGCDSVPAVWPGAKRACHRSYIGEMIPPGHYANGFCSLVAVGCSGNPMICNLGAIGDYEAMKSCPENTALVEWTLEIDAGGLRGTLSYKNCAPICKTDEDCRNTEDDPVLEEKTQYQCLDKGGVQFCQDPRNLSSDYTAEAF